MTSPLRFRAWVPQNVLHQLGCWSGCCLLAILLWAPVVQSETLMVKDRAALDKLLDKLKSAASATEAEAVTEQIWRQWFRVKNAEARQLMDQAQLARRAGAFDEALALLDRIVQVAPDYAEGWNQRATVLFMLGRDDESAADIEKVLRLEPRHFGALSGLGLIHLRARNWQAALTALERALAVHPFLGQRTLIPKLKEHLKGRSL